MTSDNCNFEYAAAYRHAVKNMRKGGVACIKGEEPEPPAEAQISQEVLYNTFQSVYLNNAIICG
jgi:hypothetical protein